MEQYIVANWKMNGTRAESEALASTLITYLEEDKSPLPHIVICPSYPYLFPLSALTQGSSIRMGAQDCSPHRMGAFTGEVNTTQLADIGCNYVIVGHSERRRYHNETNVLIRAKAEAALQQGLKPIICIGENAEAYKEDKVLSVLAKQLEACVPPQAIHSSFLIAYEPVWAIGTGLTPALEEIERIMNFLKAQLSLSIPTGDLTPTLYGGSVTPLNAHLFLGLPYVDGLLVGGASLHARDFWHIIKAAVR